MRIICDMGIIFDEIVQFVIGNDEVDVRVS